MRLTFLGTLKDMGWTGPAEAPALPTLGDLLRWIEVQRPDIALEIVRRRARVAIDGRVVSDLSTPIDGASEVLFLPPVSGG